MSNSASTGGSKPKRLARTNSAGGGGMLGGIFSGTGSTSTSTSTSAGTGTDASAGEKEKGKEKEKGTGEAKGRDNGHLEGDESVPWPGLASEYELIEQIGRGAYATVYRARCVSSDSNNASVYDGQEVAIKILELDDLVATLDNVREEVRVMRLSRHPHVLRAYASFVVKSSLWLVMPLMRKGSCLRILQVLQARERHRQKQKEREKGKHAQGSSSSTTSSGLPPKAPSISSSSSSSSSNNIGHAAGGNNSANANSNSTASYPYVGLKEEWVASIMNQALKGLEYFHKAGQVHRDIKAGNLLIDSNGNVAIADFGVAGWLGVASMDRDQGKGNANSFNSSSASKGEAAAAAASAASATSGNRNSSARNHGGDGSSSGAHHAHATVGKKSGERTTFVGTPWWMAPEVMESEQGYDEKADIWSVGITLLELAKGTPPYGHLKPLKAMMKTISEPPPNLKTYEAMPGAGSTSNQKFSRRFQEIVGLCLQRDPRLRPSCSTLLGKPFFSKAMPPDKLAKELILGEKIPDVTSTGTTLPASRLASDSVSSSSGSTGEHPASDSRGKATTTTSTTTTTPPTTTDGDAQKKAGKKDEFLAKIDSKSGFVRGSTWVFDDDESNNNNNGNQDQNHSSFARSQGGTGSQGNQLDIMNTLPETEDVDMDVDTEIGKNEQNKGNVSAKQGEGASSKNSGGGNTRMQANDDRQSKDRQSTAAQSKQMGKESSEKQKQEQEQQQEQEEEEEDEDVDDDDFEAQDGSRDGGGGIEALMKESGLPGEEDAGTDDNR